MPDSISALTNQPTPLEWQGKTYLVTELTLEAIGEFVQWAKQKAVAEADVNTLGLTDRLREEMIQAVSRDINSGYYEPGAAGFASKMNSVDGQSKILELGLRPQHPDIGFVECRKMVLGGMLSLLVFKAGYEPLGGADDDEKKAMGPASGPQHLPL